MTLTVAVDAMGGDVGVGVTVPAAVDFLDRHPDVRLILVGQPDAIEDELTRLARPRSGRLTVHAASQVVAMDDSPQSALKNKKDSSMRVAINLVKEGQAQAAVSAGNTGALMATARFVLKTIPGITGGSASGSLGIFVYDSKDNLVCAYEDGVCKNGGSATVEKTDAGVVFTLPDGKEAYTMAVGSRSKGTSHSQDGSRPSAALELIVTITGVGAGGITSTSSDHPAGFFARSSRMVSSPTRTTA